MFVQFFSFCTFLVAFIWVKPLTLISGTFVHLFPNNVFSWNKWVLNRTERRRTNSSTNKRFWSISAIFYNFILINGFVSHCKSSCIILLYSNMIYSLLQWLSWWWTSLYGIRAHLSTDHGFTFYSGIVFRWKKSTFFLSKCAHVVRQELDPQNINV